MVKCGAGQSIGASHLGIRYLDSHGDLCNNHSSDVTQGRLPADLQLFNLQTQFLITGVKGRTRDGVAHQCRFRSVATAGAQPTAEPSAPNTNGGIPFHRLVKTARTEFLASY